MWFDAVKKFYDNRHPSYNNETLKVFVQAKMITAEEYKIITGIEYIAA